MRSPGRCLLERANSIARFAAGIPLESLATGLHQHDDESGQRLPKNQREHYCQGRDEINGEPPRGYFADRFSYDRRPDDNEAYPPASLRSEGAGVVDANERTDEDKRYSEQRQPR